MSVLNRLPFSGALKSPRRFIFLPRLLLRSHQTIPKNRLLAHALEKYMTLKIGTKLLKEDALILYRGYKKVYAEGWDSLSRKELEVCYDTPSDIRRASLVIFLAFAPFCFIFCVIALYFPRQMLTRHFWSLKQKNEFFLIDHRKKLLSFEPLLFSMQTQLISLNQCDPSYEPMKQVLDCLASGMQPSVGLILECKPLFEEHYSLNNLSNSHIVALLKLYNLHRGWRRRRRLEFRASLISLMDAALIKEGGFEKLTQEELERNCFLRGLNPINMTKEDIFSWINTWLTISQEIDKNSFSLLLHCPILLGYNEPSNRGLFHGRM